MKNLIIAATVVVTIIAGGLYLNRNNRSLTKEDNITKDIENQEATIGNKADIKDGIYTNNIYNFQFEYDDEYFSNLNKDGENAYMINSDYDSYQEAINGDAVLTVSIKKEMPSSESYSEIFNTVYNQKSSWNEKVLVDNVKTNQVDGYKLLTYFFENAPDYEGEHSVAYILWAQKDNGPVIEVAITSASKDVLQSYSGSFEFIENSFSFIN